METGLRHFLLRLLLPLLLAVSWQSSLHAQVAAEGAADGGLINPEIERADFDESLIDSDDFELIAQFGYISIEDFGVNAVTILSLAYHVNPQVFVRASMGVSEGDRTSFESLTGGAPLLTDREREYEFYRIDLGYNLLPGEAFIDEQTTFNTALYISAGMGNTTFAGDDRSTISYGVGYRLILWQYGALYTEFRNNVFDLDLFGENKSTSNLEFSLGFSLIF